MSCNHLCELKEYFCLEINEDFKTYVLNKYSAFSDSAESEFQMRQEVLHDLHFYQILSFEEKSNQLDEEYNHFSAYRDSLIDVHSRAMKVSNKLGFTHLLHHPKFRLSEE